MADRTGWVKGNGQNAGKNGGQAVAADEVYGLGAHIPPNNIEAEQSTLGAMFIDYGIIPDVCAALSTADFYRQAHQTLFDVIKYLHGKDQPVDLITVPEELKRRRKFEDTGGMSYLTSLFDTVPTSANWSYYADIVRGKSKRRQMQAFAFNAIALSKQEDGDLDAALATIQDQAFALSMSPGAAEKIPTMGDMKARMYDKISAAMDAGGRPAGFMSHLTEFDKLLGGWKNGTFNLIAARPGMGKSSLAEQVAEVNAIKNDDDVAYVTIEMGGEELALRSLAGEVDIDANRAANGDLTDDEFARLTEAVIESKDVPLFIIDDPVQTVASIRTHCRRLHIQAKRKGKRGLRALIVDYIQILEPDDPRHDKANDIVGKFARELKNLARELDIPVIALAQLNRAVEQRADKRPMLSDLRDSGKLEAEADTVVFLYRDAYYNGLDPAKTASSDVVQECEILLPKNRGGRTGYCKCGFNPNRTKFVNLAHLSADSDEPTGF